jgi:hypothetical protein
LQAQVTHLLEGLNVREPADLLMIQELLLAISLDSDDEKVSCLPSS